MLRLTRRFNSHDGCNVRLAPRLVRHRRVIGLSIIGVTAGAFLCGCADGNKGPRPSATASTAARAHSVSDRDAARDVVKSDYDGFQDRTAETTPVPDRARDDVTETTLTHGTARVGVGIKFVELERVRRGADGEDWLSVKLETNVGTRWTLTLYTTAKRPDGVTEFYRGNDELVRCPVRSSIDYRDNRIMVTLPRRCIGNPRWLQFRVLAYATEGNLTLYSDDALRDGALVGDLIESPRLYRADVG